MLVDLQLLGLIEDGSLATHTWATFSETLVGFVGGASVACAYTNGRPILYRPVPPGTPAWGSAWKKAVHDTYQRVTSVGAQGSVMSYRDNHLDLDPTYKDRLGRPLLRMTFDWGYNEYKQSAFMGTVLEKVMKKMGASSGSFANVMKTSWSTVPMNADCLYSL